MKLIERYSFLVHLLGWMAFIVAPLAFFPFSIRESISEYPILIPNIVNNLFLIVLFYFNLHWLTPKTLKQGNVALFVSVLLGVVLVMWIADLLIVDFAMKSSLATRPFQPPPPPEDVVLNGMPKMPPSDFNIHQPMPAPQSLYTFWKNPQFWGMLISTILVILGSSMLVLIRERAANKELQQQMIYEKVTAELAVLKLQISPHFLFNTLNNIRWLARQKSDQTEGHILQLSELLRYMIYQANDNQVLLSQEINHLNNYIDLQRMRLVNPDAVVFEVEGETDGIMIEPMLFIPFVENAFKYGLHSQQASRLHFRIHVTEGYLHFYAENPIYETAMPSLEASGIGIQNVKKRLAFYYPQQHDISITEEAGLFVVKLSIHLG